jgi:pilus assembly protein CpaF
MSQILDNVSRSVLDQAIGRHKKLDLSLNLAVDAEIESHFGGFKLEDELELRRQAENRLFGLGQLQPLLDDASVEEIWVNGNNRVFVARSGIASQVPIEFAEGELAGLVERMLRSTGRRLDRSSPFVDASLADGSRLHVVIPDITKSAWAVNIRKFPVATLTLSDLIGRGVLTRSQAEFIANAVRLGSNILVSGATQAGKTTFLCALLECIDDSERLITAEETFEIRTSKPDWVALQTRQANLEGHGEVGLRRLIKEALRMRPNRLVVGEVREAEALDLLIAMNSGLPGLCTIHANSAEDALLKLSTLPLLAGQNISLDFVRPTIASCIHLVVHCQLDSSGQRRVVEIRRVLPFDGVIASERVEC